MRTQRTGTFLLIDELELDLKNLLLIAITCMFTYNQKRLDIARKSPLVVTYCTEEVF